MAAFPAEGRRASIGRLVFLFDPFLLVYVAIHVCIVILLLCRLVLSH